MYPTKLRNFLPPPPPLYIRIYCSSTIKRQPALLHLHFLNPARVCLRLARAMHAKCSLVWGCIVTKLGHPLTCNEIRGSSRCRALWKLVARWPLLFPPPPSISSWRKSSGKLRGNIETGNPVAGWLKKKSFWLNMPEDIEKWRIFCWNFNDKLKTWKS